MAKSRISPELRECLKSREWRLNNLYYIKTEKGEKILFRFNWAQKELFQNLHTQNIVLKARQLGITTFFAILFLDHCLWNKNLNAAIITDRYDNSKNIFRDKVKFAYDNLHPYLKIVCPAFRDNAQELRFGTGSVFRVSNTLRGGTNQLLHISEFGKICREFPQKATEIVTGALNTVHVGSFTAIESTAEGRSGYFYEMVQAARNMQDRNQALTEMDYRLFFFPWWKHPEYRLETQEAA